MHAREWNALTTEEQLALAQPVIADETNALVICGLPRFGLGSQPRCEGCDCEVEPDGQCYHGCPSLLLVMGLV
jgi:hypothetical protein